MDKDGQKVLANGADELVAPAMLLLPDPRNENREIGYLLEDGIYAHAVRMSFTGDTGYSHDALRERLTEAVREGTSAIAVGETFDNLPPFKPALPDDATTEERGRPSPRTLNVIMWVE